VNERGCTCTCCQRERRDYHNVPERPHPSPARTQSCEAGAEPEGKTAVQIDFGQSSARVRASFRASGDLVMLSLFVVVVPMLGA
jgi:hypothetical protein